MSQPGHLPDSFHRVKRPLMLFSLAVSVACWPGVQAADKREFLGFDFSQINPYVTTSVLWGIALFYALGTLLEAWRFIQAEPDLFQLAAAKAFRTTLVANGGQVAADLEQAHRWFEKARVLSDPPDEPVDEQAAHWTALGGVGVERGPEDYDNLADRLAARHRDISAKWLTENRAGWSNVIERLQTISDSVDDLESRVSASIGWKAGVAMAHILGFEFAGSSIAFITATVLWIRYLAGW